MKRVLIISFLAAFGFISVAEAQLSKVGTTAAEFLQIPVGARSTAMGATAATVNDISAMYWNPAGLATIENPGVMLEYTDWFIDVQHNYFGAAIPLGKGVAGVHVVALTMGEFEETTETVGLTGRTFDAYSISAGASYAQYLFPKLSIGGSAKFVYERIFTSSASSIAFDVGTLFETPFDGMRFGVSVTNVGSKMQIMGDELITNVDVSDNNENNPDVDGNLVTEQFDLPILLRVGFAYDPIKTRNLRATIAVDGTSPNNNFESVSVGGEIALLNEQIFIRGGIPYIGEDDRTQEFNAGVGFRYTLANSFKIDFGYTYQSFRYLNSINKISLQLNF